MADSVMKHYLREVAAAATTKLTILPETFSFDLAGGWRTFSCTIARQTSRAYQLLLTGQVLGRYSAWDCVGMPAATKPKEHRIGTYFCPTSHTVTRHPNLILHNTVRREHFYVYRKAAKCRDVQALKSARQVQENSIDKNFILLLQLKVERCEMHTKTL